MPPQSGAGGKRSGERTHFSVSARGASTDKQLHGGQPSTSLVFAQKSLPPTPGSSGSPSAGGSSGYPPSRSSVFSPAPSFGSSSTASNKVRRSLPTPGSTLNVFLTSFQEENFGEQEVDDFDYSLIKDLGEFLLYFCMIL